MNKEFQIPEMYYNVYVYGDGHGYAEMVDDRSVSLERVAIFTSEGEMYEIVKELTLLRKNTIHISFIPK